METAQKQKLKELIQGSLFLEKDVKDSLLEKFDLLTNKELAQIQELFQESEQKQSDLVGKMVEHDQTFLPRLKDFKRAEIRKFQKKTEKKERTKEKAEDILKQI